MWFCTFSGPMSSSYLVKEAAPSYNLVPGLIYYRIVLHNHLGCSQTTSGNIIFCFQMGRLGKLLWETEWILLVVPVHLESMTMQKCEGCVYGHLCILYISSHSPCKAPHHLKLKAWPLVFQSCLCNVISPFLANARAWNTTPKSEFLPALILELTNSCY